jgi:hypothetical protein
MTEALPRGFIPPPGFADDDRLKDIATHVLNVVSARALSPGEQLLALMMAAATVTVRNAAGGQRDTVTGLGCILYGSAVRGAADAVDRWMDSLPPAGRA